MCAAEAVQAFGANSCTFLAASNLHAMAAEQYYPDMCVCAAEAVQAFGANSSAASCFQGIVHVLA